LYTSACQIFIWRKDGSLDI